MQVATGEIAVFWFYELPVWVSLPLSCAVFVVVSWAILLALRPWVARVARDREEWDRVLGYAIASFGVVYGLVLALIAVSVYEDYTRVDGLVLDEVTAVNTLFRNASGYPDPISGELHELLRRYVDGVIMVDWPLQQLDVVPVAGDADVTAIQSVLFAYEPAGVGQQVLHAQTIGRFDDFVEARRARIDETTLHLPPLFWLLLGVGATINAVLLALVDAKNLRVHLIMSGLIAMFLGLVIFVTASVDHPYAGAISVTSEPFQLLRDGLLADGED